ncbi:unnamed protein product [Effrenium voratum]|nr:unnamed protein product [Effrenium voratum]
MSSRSRSRTAVRDEEDDSDGEVEEPPVAEPEAADSDDDIVHFAWQRGQVLGSRYQLEELLGDGAFGRVLLAKDMQDDRYVALKIIRDVERYRENAKIEASILKDIRIADVDGTSNCVVLHEVFLHSDVFFCMVCEVLGDSLYDFLKWNGYRGYWLQDIQAFAKQSLKGLSFLHNMSLTHTDLKPENILLRTRDSPRTAHFPRADFQPPSERYAKVSYARPASNDIKLIDFGNATYVDMHHSSVIQTRQYRSPEVILNMGWSEKADLWSLGCILFELYSGNMLFQTHSSPEHLALMERILGPFPVSMLGRANHKAKQRFLTPDQDKLQWPVLYPQGTETQESIMRVFQEWRLQDRCPPEHQAFVGFLRQMLMLDPCERVDAKEALRAEFFLKEYNE